ncbi:MAG: type II toxin-antitoxin system VapC family toxin [Polyangia bacterium]|jgi:predicted nucleic acid-binding protein
MIAYLDSSVLLRLVLRQPGALKEWSSVEEGVTSALTQVECLRTLDRLRVVERIPDEALASRREAIFGLLATLAVVDVAGAILDRAAQPLPTALGTLDAIHLATAQLWRERTGSDLTMATHDSALATAARSLGMSIVGA